MIRSELVTLILGESHRSDLAANVGDFIRGAEGMIARNVRATEIIETYTLTDSDRTVAGAATYVLPSGFLAARALWIPSTDGRSIELESKSLFELRRLSSGASVSWYAIRGANVEFRGTPAESAEIELDYYNRPAPLLLDTDTNDLLDEHEELYVSASLFFLHRYAQDFETAQGYLDSFNAAYKSLNEAAAHKIGGMSVAPVYNFHSESSY